MSKENQQNGVADFLPPDYETKAGGNNYMKLQSGENRLRILSRPIIGWLDWAEQNGKKTPLRYRRDEKPTTSQDANKPVKEFWAFIVYNYKDSAIQVLEITQATIKKSIQDLSRNEDWGNPFKYDLKITKTGENMSTEYAVMPVPHREVTKEVQEALILKPCNLEALFNGEDPFDVNDKPVTKNDALPF